MTSSRSQQTHLVVSRRTRTLAAERSPRPGAVLLEVIVAVAILALVALGATTLMTDSTSAVGRAQSVAEEMAEANLFLENIALWPRSDLDLRLGSRRIGSWELTVHRPAPELYTVTLHVAPGESSHATTTAASRELLTTSLYRPIAETDARP
jgi:hypothetical protein